MAIIRSVAALLWNGISNAEYDKREDEDKEPYGTIVPRPLKVRKTGEAAQERANATRKPTVLALRPCFLLEREHRPFYTDLVIQESAR